MLTKSSIDTSTTHPSVADLSLIDRGGEAGALRVKRCLDVVLAASALVCFSLLFGIIALAILATDRGPVLIRHRRVGRNGVIFPCLKFRTMVVNAETALVRHLAENPDAMIEWKANHKLKDDPRITPLGRILRETSLDELPQLVNSLRGEMSLVGPRPIVTEEAVRYGSAFADYKSVRPGLTGLWQCSGRNDIGYDERVLLDSRYVRTWSLKQDLLIILRTVPAVIGSRGVY